MDKIKLGNFLADLRNEKGLTQEQLAEMINVNYKTISKWECGNSTPSLETLTELSEIFEVSLYELSTCERINNPFISKDNIKKVINKENIKRFFIIKLIILILLIILLAFTTYSCIYTINNYNQFQVYELMSEDSRLHVKGLYTKIKNTYNFTLNYINYTNNKDLFLEDKIKSLEYSLLVDNIVESQNNIYLDKYMKIKEVLPQIKIHLSKKIAKKNINHFYLNISYDTEDNISINTSFKIIISNKQSNNKLFY